ncbi:hypothetical protein [Methylocystis sp. ATCC 49242]|uniref:hypothetical protein n=1 Tax=Methylocystis sp. ATCC 49242 TaxID=622637 RepID=UPI0001F8710C|nr:hypothetical protein [Methylocystis sp. ATCC 49242]
MPATIKVSWNNHPVRNFTDISEARAWLANKMSNAARSFKKGTLQHKMLFDAAEALQQLAETSSEVCDYRERVAGIWWAIDTFNIKFTTFDIGIAIRDLLEDVIIEHFEQRDCEVISTRLTERVTFVDVGDAPNPVIHLDNGQIFDVRIIAR